MNIVITAPKSTATATTEIKWVAKGGSSIASDTGRFSLRKNSKGVWRVFDGGILVAEAPTKEVAKSTAQAHQDVEGSGLGLKAALADGTAQVHSVRANGTLRRRHFLTGDDLTTALQVRAARELGKSMSFIANELHVSISSVRRMLVDLALTEELNAADQAELEALIAGASE